MRIGILVALVVWSSACSDGGGAAMTDAGSDGAIEADGAILGALGEACSGQDTCASGHCVDGVCCDTACDGACATCGGDGVCGAVAEATECRPAAGACDVAETCDGVSLACPTNAVVTAEVVCRASVGACDVEEICDGVTASCPADELVDSGSVCREAAESTCDADEVCDGVVGTCPTDQPAAAGETCGSYLCSGGSFVCPTSCTSHADCVGGTVCANNACTPAKWAFVTSSTNTGNFGGLTGADAFCQQSAGIGGLTGTYRAWLADDTGTPSSRFARSAVPYVMPAGNVAIVLANDYADLTDGTLGASFDRNENGGTVAASVVYTNVTAGGGLIASVQDCSDWTSALVGATGGLGSTSATGSAWTNNGGVTCNAARRIFCFEQ